MEAVDRFPDQIPNAPTPVTIREADGNHVILALGDGRYAFYAHLEPNSVRVKRGDGVREGEVLGRLGNSRSSTGPHLHFHVMNRPSALAADGLPTSSTASGPPGRSRRSTTPSSQSSTPETGARPAGGGRCAPPGAAAGRRRRRLPRRLTRRRRRTPAREHISGLPVQLRCKFAPCLHSPGRCAPLYFGGKWRLQPLLEGERRDSNPRPPGPQPETWVGAGLRFGSTTVIHRFPAALSCSQIGPQIGPHG